MRSNSGRAGYALEAERFGADRNATQAMLRLIPTTPPLLAPSMLDCGTQLTKRWTRGAFIDRAPDMAGHIVAGYHGRSQDSVWTFGRRRLADRLRPGTITVIPEGHGGHWTIPGPIDVSHIYLTQRRLQDCAEALGTRHKAMLQARLGFEDPIAAHLLAILSDEELLDDPGAPLLVGRALDLLCLHLLRQHGADGRPVRRSAARGGLAAWQLRRVTSHMMDRLDRPTTLQELADMAGLSRYHFCTAFRRTTGLPPHLWLNEQRMRQARRLLDDPALSISEVAMAVGYATPSAFTASFRRSVGITPSGYRRGS